MTRKTKLGTITIRDDANVWPHEMKSAKTLIKYGHNVELLPESKRDGEKRADCYLDNVLWEMKAPRGATVDVVERNLRRAAKKSTTPWQDHGVSPAAIHSRHQIRSCLEVGADVVFPWFLT